MYTNDSDNYFVYIFRIFWTFKSIIFFSRVIGGIFLAVWLVN